MLGSGAVIVFDDSVMVGVLQGAKFLSMNHGNARRRKAQMAEINTWTHREREGKMEDIDKPLMLRHIAGKTFCPLETALRLWRRTLSKPGRV